jgi:uncharacterized membrane protein (DUF4010 family)
MAKLNQHQAVTAISLAVLSNMIFKFGLVIFIGGMALAKRVVTGFVAMGTGIVLGMLLF